MLEPVRQPRVDYGQALPVYQPPTYTHPPHVAPVDPVRAGSGAYPVRGAAVRLPAAAGRTFVASGSDARVIVIGDAGRPHPARRRR